MGIKVSIIVPAYNVEKYVGRCLNSILQQSYPEFEVICVDDDSEDSTFEELKKYSEMDGRIQVYKNSENRGLAYTRNRGMQYATGEYILFVDSDDYIETDLVRDCVAKINGSDMVCFDYSQIVDNTQADIKSTKYMMQDGQYQGEEYFCKASENNSVMNSAWSKMYSKKFLQEHSICFEEGLLYEDALFSYLCFIHAQKIYSLNKKLYVYRTRKDSIMTKQIKLQCVESYFDILCRMTEQYLKGNYSGKMCIGIECYIRRFCKDFVAAYRKWDKGKNEHVKLSESNYEKIYNIYAPLAENIEKTELLKVDMKEISKWEYIIIYGAGEIAGAALQMMNVNDIAILGIVVSKVKDKKTFMGHRICELSEFINIREKVLVLIATSPIYYAEIEVQLEKAGFYNYVEAVR